MFIKKGFEIFNIKNINNLKYIEKKIISLINKKKKFNNNLNELHKFFDEKNLNNLRFYLFEELNKDKKFKKNYFEIFKPYLYEIVGNELVMQKKINLSIQFPFDDSSLLPIHSDTWNGNSPYEVVCWLPLVNVNKSKSMFILPRNSKKNKYLNKIGLFKSNKSLFKKLKSDLKFINIKKKQLLIFSQNCPHGNVINSTTETRVSLNCRFKSLFSPYHEKSFLEYFEPVEIKPATQLGIEYNEPKF